MKVNRHGRAKILTIVEIQILFSDGLKLERDRVLFGVMLFTACRINEACTLRITDVYDRRGRVMEEIIFRKQNTKGKLATRTIPVFEDLRILLTNYSIDRAERYLFPGRLEGHLQPDSASRIFRKACISVGIVGASTHSFRRTALTQMSNGGIPLRVIQEVSGHRNLGQLQKYLEVQPEQVRGAIASLSMLSPDMGNGGEKCHEILIDKKRKNLDIDAHPEDSLSIPDIIDD